MSGGSGFLNSRNRRVINRRVTSNQNLNTRERATLAKYQAAYDTMKNYLATVKPGYKFVLTGNDPMSFGYHEGLRSNSPWAFKLWRSSAPPLPPHTTYLDWGWADELIASDDTHIARANIKTKSDMLNMSSTSFDLSDEEYNTFPNNVKKAIDIFNNLKLRAYINDYYEATTPGTNGLILHKISIISDEDIATLKTWGYGWKLFNRGSSDNITVYGIFDGIASYFEGVADFATSLFRSPRVCGGCY